MPGKLVVRQHNMNMPNIQLPTSGKTIGLRHGKLLEKKLPWLCTRQRNSKAKLIVLYLTIETSRERRIPVSRCHVSGENIFVCIQYISRGDERKKKSDRARGRHSMWQRMSAGFKPATVQVHGMCVGLHEAAGRLQEVWMCGFVFYWSNVAGRNSAGGKGKLEEKRSLGWGRLDYWRQSNGQLFTKDFSIKQPTTMENSLYRFKLPLPEAQCTETYFMLSNTTIKIWSKVMGHLGDWRQWKLILPGDNVLKFITEINLFLYFLLSTTMFMWWKYG